MKYKNIGDIVGTHFNNVLSNPRPKSDNDIYVWAIKVNAYGDGEDETRFIKEDSLYRNIVLGRFNDMSSNVGKAVAVAKEYITKLDKEGKPVYIHALRIASALDMLGYDEDYIVTAILHDIIEDADRELGDVLWRFNRNVRKAIHSLTRKKTETYFEYIERVRQGSDLAIKVKQFDVYDHLYFKQNINDSLIKRYETASEILNTKLENGIISEDIQNV